jgi:transcriptional regulator with XRE-family HTH domain
MSRKTQPTAGIGERLRKLRELKGKTQEEAAREMGLVSGTVSRWEREVGSPQAEQLVVLARYYDVSLDHLILGTPSEPAVHLPELHQFLSTKLGHYAKKRGLVTMLRNLAYHEPITADIYRGIVKVFRDQEEAEQDAEGEADLPKKPAG